MQPRHNPDPAVSERELSEISALIERRSGLHFDRQESVFSGRVREHLQSRRLAHGAELLRLMHGSSAEYDSLLARLLSREDCFFQHAAMFETLEKIVLPEIRMRKFWDNPRSLRVWDAACGAGHEAYSVALTLTEALDGADTWAIYMLASDLSRYAVHHAQRGVYSRAELGSVTAGQLEVSFARIGEQFLVKPNLRKMVNFAAVNLLECAHMGHFDCIFCTDGLAYYPEDRRHALVLRFVDALEPGGYFFVTGANSGALPHAADTLHAGDIVIYRKPISADGRNGHGRREV